jgi:glycosyltransferase involved in cell wall biosynthesis
MNPVHNPLEGAPAELTIPLHDGTEEQVSIVVVHNDKAPYLNLTLQSIALATINNNYEMIVVDNNSGKESQDFLDAIEEDGIKVIRNEKNLYWSAAANKGAAHVSKNSKYIVFMHHDVVVLNSAWLDLMINVAESQNSGMVGLELGQYYMQNQKVDFVQEWCVLFSKQSWKELGPFPETLPQIGHSFIMTMKAQIKGHKPQVMRNPVCHHYRTFSVNINEFERFTERAMQEIPRLMRDLQSMPV